MISKDKKIFLIIFGLFLLFPIRNPQAQQQVYGIVLDEKGVPISGAMVKCIESRNIIQSTISDENGYFEASFPYINFNIEIFYDIQNTTAPDYFHYSRSISNYNGSLIEIRLVPSATINFNGNIRLINTEKILDISTIKIINPINGKIFNIENYGELIIPSHLKIREIQVPIETRINFELEYYYNENRVTQRVFFTIIDALNGSLTRGDILDFNIYDYMGINFGLFTDYFEEVNNTLKEMDSFGFYLTKPKNSLASAEYYLAESRKQYSFGAYDDSFSLCKIGYIELEQTYASLISNAQDARISIYILVIFFALTSSTIAFFMVQKALTRVGVGFFFYSLMMVVLYYVYPTTKSIELELYIGACFVSLIFSMGIGFFAPRFMGGGESFGRIPLRSILPDILSIAKRNCHQRKLRFILTFISITLFIASFVALTSVYEGYGVIVDRVGGIQEKEGVLLRPNGYNEWKPFPVFFEMNEYTSGWIENQSETEKTAPKIENVPKISPIFYLIKENNKIFTISNDREFKEYLVKGIQGYVIEGVIGIDSEKENIFSEIDSALIQGVLPSRKGIIIGSTLRDHLGIEIGDVIKINMDEYLIVEGIFDESLLSGISDLDGSTILPDKLISPIGGEGNLIVRVPCESNNVLIMHYQAALNTGCMLSQISIRVDEKNDVNKFAGRLALERGYWAYASSNSGVYLHRVDNYIEAKGFQLAVPWVIVILNVIITILNSMFERRKEANILSAIGVNPTQLSFIFITEASILGLISGGIGYLMGLSLYSIMAILGISLDINQKISAFWSFASIFISFMSVVAGSIVAIRFSTTLTPSMMRRWDMDDKKDGIYEPIKILIPISIIQSELKPFVKFFFIELFTLDRQVVKSKLPLIDYSSRYIRIPFNYRAPAVISSGSLTINTLVIDQESRPIQMVLESRGDRDFIRETGNLIRNIAMKWSMSKEKQFL